MPGVGVCGAAFVFDGTNDTMSGADPTNTLEMGTRSFSYSAWVLVDQSAGEFDVAFHKGGAAVGNPGYDLELGFDSWNASLTDVSTAAIVSFGLESSFLHRWVHLVAVVDRDRMMVTPYADGIPLPATAIPSLGSLSGGNPVTFSLPGYNFAGILDEVHVYNQALQPEWIAAEHANLVNRGGFVTIGAEQLP
jgi:hypothetical protein